MRAALEFLRERGEFEDEAGLLVAAAHHWSNRGSSYDEARTALERVLARELSSQRRVDALTALANFLIDKADAPRRIAVATEAVALARSLDDPERLAVALNTLGGAHLWADDLAAADRAWVETEALARAEGRPSLRANALNNRGWSATLRGDYENAVPLHEEAVDLSPAPCFPLHNLGLIALKQGHAERALASFAAAIRCAQPLGWAPIVVASLEGIAAILGDHNLELAVTLLGAAEAQRAHISLPDDALVSGMIEHAIKPLRAAVAETCAIAYEHGQTMRLEDAAELALTAAVSSASG